jgi:integrase/recombinase XerD
MSGRRRSDPFLGLVESFFQDHLQRVRGVSRHTFLSYRDALRLFFAFLSDACEKPVAALRLDDLTVERVIAFLDHLESHRGNGAATRNARLTAVRGFLQHVLRHDPSRAAQYQRMLSLPSKRAPTPLVTYLEPEEMRQLLRQPDRRKAQGLRDYALMLFLYNTGARISEALAVRWDELQLARPHQVQLHGKGRKDRVCPLWPDTAAVLGRLGRRPEDQLVFRSSRGGPLSRDGVAHLLRKYVQLAARGRPSLAKKRVTPHVLRHSCAVALLQAGVDLTVIRDYLGHESIVTTGRYTRSNLQMKRRVLEAFWDHAGLVRSRDARWSPPSDVLEFLSSL